jgi:hypothetical protein
MHDKVLGRGANGSMYHEVYGCERIRLGCKSGEDYDLCEGCAPINHSERSALLNVLKNGYTTKGADLYLWGHWWCCADCWNAMNEAGISRVFLLEGCDVLFNKNHPNNIVGKQFAGLPMKIAFGYKQGSGKDISADYLDAKYGGLRLSFASPIYNIMCYAQTTLKLPIKKDRDFLQWLGMWGRSKDPDIFVNSIISQGRGDSNVYISDLRFPNEFSACREAGYLLVKIERPGLVKDMHCSETFLDNYDNPEWDAVITNNGDLGDLYDELDGLVRRASNRIDFSR